MRKSFISDELLNKWVTLLRKATRLGGIPGLNNTVLKSITIVYLKLNLLKLKYSRQESGIVTRYYATTSSPSFSFSIRPRRSGLAVAAA